MTPTYDLAGNLITGPSPANPAIPQHYVYDAWNRLVGVYADSSGSPGALVAAYGYDGSGQRTQKTLGTGEAAVVTDYYYNQSWQVVQETATAAGGGGVARNTSYVWSLTYIDTPVCRIAEGYTAGETTVPAQTLYYLTDAHANVTALVDGTAGSVTEGQVVERYSYDASGNVTFLAADWSGQVVPGHADGTASALGNEILYSGYRRDAEVGGYQVRHREYLPGLGVWMQRDPWGYVDGMNDREYVGGNPIKRLDPRGLQGELNANIAADNAMDGMVRNAQAAWNWFAPKYNAVTTSILVGGISVLTHQSSDDVRKGMKQIHPSYYDENGNFDSAPGLLNAAAVMAPELLPARTPGSGLVRAEKDLAKAESTAAECYAIKAARAAESAAKAAEAARLQAIIDKEVALQEKMVSLADSENLGPGKPIWTDVQASIDKELKARALLKALNDK